MIFAISDNKYTPYDKIKQYEAEKAKIAAIAKDKEEYEKLLTELKDKLKV